MLRFSAFRHSWNKSTQFSKKKKPVQISSNFFIGSEVLNADRRTDRNTIHINAIWMPQ